MDSRVKTVIDLMERHLADTVSVEELARAVGLSPSYLTQLFRRATGQSPARYWRDMRLARARTLLQVPSLSVTDVMDAVGWTADTRFRRDFRYAHGLGGRIRAAQVEVAPTEEIASAEKHDQPTETDE